MVVRKLRGPGFHLTSLRLTRPAFFFSLISAFPKGNPAIKSGKNINLLIKQSKPHNAIFPKPTHLTDDIRIRAALQTSPLEKQSQKQGLDMKRAFSLVELMIVVAILGILAAIVVPKFQNNTTEAKAAVAKNNLRILRSAIELYTAQRSGVPPGYPDNNPANTPTASSFKYQMTEERSYLKKMPQNPFNELTTLKMIGNSGLLPADATGEFGWIYKPKTKQIRLDWPGSGKKGFAYYQY